eukprot:gnl/TRDRNA2_/TRDRNA2_177554_c0_seq24.p1 gnl/TRDRNA2_/TRDRNA2_177554_c0~~gnl/TRDRNA2_/TRDRNA2_177554_c0_seq24.p1  ORF type:complete len:182 (-),score=56.87 gnl/TRDRNA2_/TRDRNA2_177554_c0_seq24:126-671(-)
MQMMLKVLSLALLVCASARTVAHLRAAQEPDTACGKGFDELVQGSKDWFATASVELFTHPGHTTDNATFATELKCWFANMCTSKCGGLESQAGSRKADLAAKCQDPNVDWLQIWKMFSLDEVKYFKKDYPAVAMDPEEAGSDVSYKQAMFTVKEADKKEVLCLTLFTIDDECVKYVYIRMK